MKATYTPETAKPFNAKAHRRENGGFQGEIAALVPCSYDKKRMRAVVTLRIYGTSTGNSVCIWIGSKDGDKLPHTSGSARAGGCGYHRPSQAAETAIRNAGWTLSEAIGGVGETAMRDAVLALAKAIGYPAAKLHEAHA